MGVRVQSLTSEEEGGLVRTTIYRQALDDPRQSHFSLALLFAYRKSGQHEKAQVVAKQFEDRSAERIEAISAVSELPEYPFLYEEVQYYAIEGRRTEALAKLQAWVDHGKNIFTYIKWDPFLENLRGDPEFEAIVAEVEVELAEVRVQYHARQAKLIDER